MSSNPLRADLTPARLALVSLAAGGRWILFIQHRQHDRRRANARLERAVRLSVGTHDDATEIEIRDEGSGIPAIERTALDQRVEEPLAHSDGLGLWIARSLVAEARGTMVIEDNEPRGSVVRINLPAGG